MGSTRGTDGTGRLVLVRNLYARAYLRIRTLRSSEGPRYDSVFSCMFSITERCNAPALVSCAVHT